jgi:ATP-dependent helicase IRC3
MLELRPYQSECLTAIEEAESRSIKRPLVALPTGTGKTIIFSHLIAERPGRSLVLAHRDELISQAAEKMSLVAPMRDLGIVKAERDEHDAPTVLASVQTLARPNRLGRVTADFQTIVVDEAHHAAAETYQRILEHLGMGAIGGPLVTGFTATPERSDKLMLGNTFDEIVYQRSILDMIYEGYLCDLRAVQVMLETDFDALRTHHGDFAERDLEASLLAANAPQHVLEAWQEHASDRKTLIFTPTVATAHEMAHAFKEAGIQAEALDGSTPLDERRAMLKLFHSGDIQVLVNCAVLTEGFDEPSVGCIVIARPTTSRPLYIQMIGRGTRIYPGKPDCLILDVVGASSRHELQTASSLFKIELEPDKTLTEALDEREQQQALRMQQEAGQLTSRMVDLFARRPMNWVQTRSGIWVLSLTQEHGMIRLVQRPDDTWCVLQSRKGQPPVTLGQGLPLTYAQGRAEDFVRSLGLSRLVSADAQWRARPPSESQLSLLRRLGIGVPAALTKGTASDLITAEVGDWN